MKDFKSESMEGRVFKQDLALSNFVDFSKKTAQNFKNQGDYKMEKRDIEKMENVKDLNELLNKSIADMSRLAKKRDKRGVTACINDQNMIGDRILQLENDKHFNTLKDILNLFNQLPFDFLTSYVNESDKTGYRQMSKRSEDKLTYKLNLIEVISK